MKASTISADDCLLILDELNKVMSGTRILLRRAQEHGLDNLLPDDFTTLGELYERLLAEQRRYTRELIAVSRSADGAIGDGHNSCDSRAPVSLAVTAAGASET